MRDRTLDRIRKTLNIDQRNLLVGTVIANRGDTLRLRTGTGGILTAGNLGGDYAPGDRVEISTNGKTHTVTGSAPLTDLGGQKIIWI